MSKETTRLRALAKQSASGSGSGSGNSEKTKNVSAPIEAHAPHGDKGEYLKVTATLSPEVYKLLSDEMQRRKLAREPNAQLSAILREAVLQYLSGRE